MDLSQRNEFCYWYLFFEKLISVNKPLINGWFNLPTTQISIFILFESALVLLEGTFSLWVTAQKMEFFIKDFFSKCDQIHSFLWIWSHLLKKTLMKNSIFCAVSVLNWRKVPLNLSEQLRNTSVKLLLVVLSSEVSVSDLGARKCYIEKVS